jgi:hypothetical protein
LPAASDVEQAPSKIAALLINAMTAAACARGPLNGEVMYLRGEQAEQSRRYLLWVDQSVLG